MWRTIAGAAHSSQLAGQGITMTTSVTLLKGLACNTRLTLLQLIQAEQELCVCELVAALEESQPKISRHLARLKADGLLQDRRQGQWVYYSLAELPAWVPELLEATRDDRAEHLALCLNRLHASGDRPERVAACCN